MKKLLARAHWNQITYTVEVIRIEAVGTHAGVIPFTTRNHAVDIVSREAETAGLHSLDRVLGINETLLTGGRDLHEAVKNGHPGDLVAPSVIPKGGGPCPVIRL